LVLRPADLKILQVSENSHTWLGLAPDQLLDKNVKVAVGESVAKAIGLSLRQERLEKASHFLTTLPAGAQKNPHALHISLHTNSGLVLLELEDAGFSGNEAADLIIENLDYHGLIRKTLTRFQETSSVQSLAEAVSDEVRRVTEMDRAMVYYFHADDSGEIIGEAKRKDQASWLGWRYPAHDIPRPAREIFKKIWSRPVPDVRGELFEMLPLLNPETSQPLDMTYCSLRGASVMYTEYLDNMGVRAAFTLPLMQGDKLWGLIACHHDTPRLMSYRMRAAAEFIARGASQQLMITEEREHVEYRLSLERANYALISKLALAPETSAFTEGPVHLGSALDCGGAAILCQDAWKTVGQAPQGQVLADLGRWLIAQPACQEGAVNPILVTDSLASLYPPAKEFADIGSGLMAFCFSRQPLGLVLYFKPEAHTTLRWGGNPNELPVADGPNGPRLCPRKSFELWRETVRDRSMPWKKIEIDSTLNLRQLIVDMLVSKAEQVHSLRLQVEERTREVKRGTERLDAIVTGSLDGIVVLEAVRDDAGALRDFSYSLINPAAQKLMERDLPDLMGSTLLETFPNTGSDGLFEKCRRIVDEGVSLDFEYLSQRRETPRWYRMVGVKLGDGVAISYAEITARKFAEELLKTSAQRLGLATQALQAGIWERDLRTGRLTWDDRMYEIYGQPKDAPIDYETWTRLVLPEDLARVQETVQAAIDSRSQSSIEFRVKLPDGSVRHIQGAEGVVLDDGGKVVRVVGVNLDVTDRKKLEQQFLQTQRMESIGRLSSGIAHELNNILAPITMSIELLQSTAVDPESRDILKTIAGSAQRGADIVRQVLSFARGVQGERIQVLPQALLKDLEQIVSSTFPKNIQLLSSCANDVWPILGDPTQMHQVLLNLCLNARDAMPNGGLLSLTAGNVVLDEHFAAMHIGAQTGPYVMLSVTDTGTGMPPALLDKIFEPFFTTKELNKGTGLGLSTVMGIVSSHGGTVNVYSEQGKGTTFKVFLPVALASLDQQKKQTATGSLMQRGNGETILVIDDEAAILAITRKTLLNFGYQVLTAGDGVEAVALYARDPSAVDVVLTDIMMPILDGPATIRALLRINPAVKIIAASGLNENGSAAKVDDKRVKRFLMKPYTADTLLGAIRKTLEEP
jgi:PAS domain S-box-containing protein